MQSNEVIVYRVMMYANPLLILQAINYTESVLHICSLQGDSGLTYSISIFVNSSKCTVQLTEHTGRELPYPSPWPPSLQSSSP